ATGQTLTVVETGDQTFIGRILGSGALAKSGAGTLTLQNSANSFTGGVTVHGGTFRTLGNSAGSNIVVNSGATLAMAGTDTWGAAPVTSTPRVTINSGGTMTSDGQFNSLRDLTLNGGTVKLNGGLSNCGAFAWGGTVTASGALTSTVTATTGTNNYLRLGRQGTAESTTFHVGLASGRLEVGAGLMNNFGATSGLNKTGDGSLVLTGTNGFTGTTTVSGGSLVVSQAAWTATILPNSITAQFSATPATGVYEILPGPLASPSLAAQSVTGLGSGQTGTLTNSPNLRLVVSPSLPANAKPMVNPGQTFQIAETSAAGTRVGTILATDSDSAAISLGGWTIISGNTGNMFGLNWSTGELTVQGALDYEARSTYTLAVSVSDGRATSDAVNVTVEVDNVAEFADGFGSSAVATELHAAGIPNLAAYALGAMNANSAVTLPVQAMNTSNSATYLTLTALVRTNDPRGQLRGNATTNLNQWPSNPSIAGVPTADQTGAAPGTTQRQLFRVECGADTKKFLRLETGIAMAQSSPLPDPPSIQAQIEAAVAAGQGQVRIQPGVYTNIVPTGINPHVQLAGIRDLDIDATGVVLVGTRLCRALVLLDCTNVTLRGLTIDYAPLPMTQGTIEGFGPSREWTDVRIHPGYPSPGALTNGWGFLWASDPLTRRIKAGIANLPNLSTADLGGGLWRVTHGASFPDSATVGDHLRIPQPVIDNTALVVGRCSNLTLSHLTLHSSPFHFGTVFGWNDRLTLQSCRIVPGPTPAGATEPRLFSTVGDGFHFHNTTGGLSLLDCETDSTGDDGIAVYDLPLLVGAVADGGKTITLSFALAGGTDSRWAKRPAAGTRFRFYVAATGTIEEGLVTNRTASTLTSAAWLALRNQLVAGTTSASMFNEPFVVQLQNAVSAAPGDEARMLDDPFETVIRGCRVRNSGSRGIVANTSRVRVENNQIEDTLLPAVHIMADTKEGGAGFQDDISIRSNSITRGNLSRSTSSDYLGSISVVNWDTNRPTFGGHRRITMENNTIAESWGVDVQVHTATNVILRGNRFVDSHRLSAGNGSPRPVDNTAAIFLQDVRTAVVESNQLVRPGPYFGAQPLSTQGVTDLQAGQAFVP
ncbi:MAG: hypothetical protein EBS47_12130, partial [Betaproteobacteria bacterium]|nr:hypothetical protein [Betaproteobacteria bacterium]